MKIIPYIIYLYILGLYYTILSDLTVIYGATVDLAALMVALVALYKSETAALWFAISVGIIVGSRRLDLMPWEMAILAVLALIVNQISARMNLESSISRLILLAVVFLIHQSVIAFLVSSDDLFFVMYRTILPGILFSLLIGWIFLQFRDVHATWRRFKALF